jgi:hypothetical protein
MRCAVCQSANQVEFTTEMMIHFSGLQNIDDRGIPVSPQVLVCIDCGASRFTVPEAELALLARRSATSNRQPPPGEEFRTAPGLTDKDD